MSEVTGTVTVGTTLGSTSSTDISGYTDFDFSNWIPYTGANKNANLGTYTFTASNLLYNTSSTPIFYVATDGSDSNNGTSASTPFLTPQKALNEAARYSTVNLITIRVADGTYLGTYTIPYGLMGRIKIIGNSSTPANVIFDGNGGSSLISHKNNGVYLTIDGIRFTNTTFLFDMEKTRLDIGYCIFDNFDYAFSMNYNSIAILRSAGYLGSSTITGKGTGHTTYGFSLSNGSVIVNQQNLVITEVTRGISAVSNSRISQATTGSISITNSNDVSYNDGGIYIEDGFLFIGGNITVNGTVLPTAYNYGIQAVNSLVSIVSAKTFTLSNLKYGVVLRGRSNWREVATNTFNFTNVTTNAWMSYDSNYNGTFTTHTTGADFETIPVEHYSFDVITPVLSSGTSAPATTPAKVGNVYVDTNSKKVYFSTGTSSSTDWTVIN